MSERKCLCPHDYPSAVDGHAYLCPMSYKNLLPKEATAAIDDLRNETEKLRHQLGAWSVIFQGYPPPRLPKSEHIHPHEERWPHWHYPEGLHNHADPQAVSGGSP